MVYYGVSVLDDVQLFWLIGWYDVTHIINILAIWLLIVFVSGLILVIHVEQSTHILVRPVWTVLSTLTHTVPIATFSGCSYCFRVEITSALFTGNESQFLRKRLFMSHYWYWRPVLLISRYNYWPYTISFLSRCDWKALDHNIMMGRDGSFLVSLINFFVSKIWSLNLINSFGTWLNGL